MRVEEIPWRSEGKRWGAFNAGRKILLFLPLLCLYICFPLFSFPPFADYCERASLTPPHYSLLFSAALPFLLSRALLFPYLSIFLPFHSSRCERAVPPALLSLSHFVFASKCGIQQGFHAACGGAESAPVCRYARGRGAEGASGK